MKQILTGLLCLFVTTVFYAQGNVVSSVSLNFEAIVPGEDVLAEEEPQIVSGALLISFNEPSIASSLKIDLKEKENNLSVYSAEVNLNEVGSQLVQNTLTQSIGEQDQLFSYKVSIAVLDGSGNIIQQYNKDIQ